MKLIIAGLIAGLIVGALLSLLIIFYSTPARMFKEHKSKHDFETTVAEFEKSVLANQWTLPHVNNLQASMMKAGTEVNKILVYEICKPEIALKILQNDRERIVSSMMPCRVSIYEKSDGLVYLSYMNAGAISKSLGKVVDDAMTHASQEMQLIIEPLILRGE